MSRTEYLALQQQLFNALQNLTDANPNYTNGTTAVFDKIYTRPVPHNINDPQFGRRQTNDFIGQVPVMSSRCCTAATTSTACKRRS